MESGKKLHKVFKVNVPVAGPDDPSWPPVTKEQVNSIRDLINTEVYTKAFGQRTIRFHNDIANDILRSTGRMKIWNSYTPDVFEKIFVEQGLIPIGYYYSTFDVDTNELVFLSQDNYVTKRIIQIRWKINKWFIKRGW